MSTPLRVSARTLAEYTYFQEDILPLRLSLLDKGKRAHIAHQAASAMEKEAALSWEGEYAGLSFYVSGRADLLQTSPLAIEEIKLCEREAPLASKDAHRAQAEIYAFMAMRATGAHECAVCVRYVRENGETAAAFDEVLKDTQAEAIFFSLLAPYAEQAQKEEERRKERDLSLLDLDFPYPAFRAGQREMAAQVYTAIARRRRLFAGMPTGSGKTAAVLYPSVKALGRGETERVLFLTARTTGRISALDEIQRMQSCGARLRAVALSAKEKCCPMEKMHCDPDYCPRAKGHYVRAREALLKEEARLCWDEAAVARVAERFSLCPFEFSLALAERADVVVCDYNYAFDPLIRLEKVFFSGTRPTVLMDEAHNIEDRARDMLSCSFSTLDLTMWRRETGRTLGRTGAAYRAFTRCIKVLKEADEEEAALLSLYEALSLAADAVKGLPLSFSRTLYRAQFLLGRAVRKKEEYAILLSKRGKERTFSALCLYISGYLNKLTARFAGSVFFSATLLPLEQMRTLLGGEEEDACFALLSPFPKERLFTVYLPVNTRYEKRQETLPLLADAIRALFKAKNGHYLVCFPSYRYMQSVAELLCDLPLHVQKEGMDEGERALYLSRFEKDTSGFLGLCVMGGVFSESVDLKGDALIGVCVMGVGLPTVSKERERLREAYQQRFGKGFDFAYRYPGMHRVVQAAGRVIRDKEDRGVVLLLDDRYGQAGYRALLPEHMEARFVRDTDELKSALLDFWAADA